ncbi:unnamed protein product [Paramecium sonneborni]|uniref:Uncharacterized protein n=1 Tax=Paramecium sonneborni TaxID=65129 RepID=A0A8S1PD89_9CILI|nr:unnamed protein product [Paramecium sonneborni]
MNYTFLGYSSILSVQYLLEQKFNSFSINDRDGITSSAEYENYLNKVKQFTNLCKVNQIYYFIQIKPKLKNQFDKFRRDKVQWFLNHFMNDKIQFIYIIILKMGLIQNFICYCFQKIKSRSGIEIQSRLNFLEEKIKKNIIVYPKNQKKNFLSFKDKKGQLNQIQKGQIQKLRFKLL